MNMIKFKEQENSYEKNEAIKLMRTNLQFCREDRKVIVVTSSIAREGKTNTALDLAKSLAKIKKKVLFIDADIRKSVIATQHVDGANHAGLTHFLSGQSKLAEVICQTNIPNLQLIPSGTHVSHAPELFSGPKLDKLLEVCREVYDYIIVDTAPVGLVVDALIVAEKSDGVVLVIESGKIKYSFAQGVKKKIEASGCDILGVVVTKLDRKKSGRYYGKYYGSYYGTKDNN